MYKSSHNSSFLSEESYVLPEALRLCDTVNIDGPGDTEQFYEVPPRPR